jgi:hypothetical protein
MYPHEGINTNTSRVDPLALRAARESSSIGGPDSGDSDEDDDGRLPARFHRFPAAPAYDVLLPPGSMLYIPPRWWHHVTALTLSVSVSFWWAASSAGTTAPVMHADHVA